MFIRQPHLCTVLEIWWPKYHSDTGEWEFWPSKYKVHHASPTIIVKFTKAKHLIGQRFAIRRTDIEKTPIGTNRKIDVYRVPFSALEPYDTPADIINTANEIFNEERI